MVAIATARSSVHDQHSNDIEGGSNKACTNRTSGISKLKIRGMGGRYLFIVPYCLIERLLSRGDYRRKPAWHTSLEKLETVQRMRTFAF